MKIIIMKSFIYIVSFILLAVAGQAGIDSVKVNKVSVVPSKVDDNWLVSTPRNHIVCLSASGELIVTTKNDPDEYLLKYTADTGTTWSDSLNELHPGNLGFTNHHHLSVANDTIYLTDIPIGGAGLIDTGTVWVVDATGTLTEIRETLFEVETDNADKVYVGSAKKLPNSDTVIYIYRDIDTKASNVSYVMTTDEFSTVGTKGFVSDGGVDCRIGLFYFNNSVSAQVYWRDTTVALYHWNRAAKTWDTETNNPFSGITSSRNYSVVSLGDSILFASLEASTPDTLLYAWRHKDTATWHTDTLAVHSANTMGKVSLEAVESTEMVFAFYSMDSVSGSYNVWYKYWKDGVWSAETQIIGDSINGYRISTPDRVPEAHGDVAYLYFNDATNDQLKLMVFDIYESADVEHKAQIIKNIIGKNIILR